MFIRTLPTILLLILLSSLTFAWQGKVVKVTDGDTVTVLNVDKRQVKVRLYGIDAPEAKQAYGTKSKQHLSKLVFGKVVEVEDYGKDFYGRTIGKIFLDGDYINLALIKGGMAWHYRQYAPRDTELAAAQEIAQHNQIGLWSDKNPIAPSAFRRAKKAPK